MSGIVKNVDENFTKETDTCCFVIEIVMGMKIIAICTGLSAASMILNGLGILNWALYSSTSKLSPLNGILYCESVISDLPYSSF